MKRFILTLTLAIGLLLLITSCGDLGDNDNNVIFGTGTITYSSIEGGCWGIHMDQGTFYEFNDLPDSYRQDGLRVKLQARQSRRFITYCYSSDGIIDIDYIWLL